MPYSNWQIALNYRAQDEWFDFDRFASHIRLLRLTSFSKHRENIRSHLNLAKHLKRCEQPFDENVRFPENVTLINTSYIVDRHIRSLLSTIDLPDGFNGDSTNWSTDAMAAFLSHKNMYYAALNELLKFTNALPLNAPGNFLFDRRSFETSFNLRWTD